MKDCNPRSSIGSMSRRIVVVGGGIAGLAAAHRLFELSRERSLRLEVTLLEASSRLGGAIATERVDDFLVEAGPDSFISEKPSALRLCERLGLASRLVSTQAAYQKIYIVYNGRLVLLPEGFFLLAPTHFWPFVQTPLFSWGGKLRMAAELFLPRGEKDGDESFGSFVRRRFGVEALERVAQPLVGGIYASDPNKLSLAATMPRFPEMEQNKRSIIWAMWAEQRRGAHNRESGSGARWSLFVTLAGGMQELVDTVAKNLPEGAVRTAPSGRFFATVSTSSCMPPANVTNRLQRAPLPLSRLCAPRRCSAHIAQMMLRLFCSISGKRGMVAARLSLFGSDA